VDLIARLSASLAGRYEILREIGRGGMSVVYLARDLSLDREVALKALRPELTASVGADRFQREIQLVAHFEHIHLLQLHASGTADGVLYYIMPYSRDGSLRDRLRRERQLGLDEVVRVTREVAEGIAHAHARGVVHRDIKPENILFIDGHAVVADFGIAHAYSEAGGETFTEYGIAIGTPPYMSPEQAAGDAHIDHRSDIYSLACVVYEMLTGGPPFEGPTTQAVLAKQMQERVPSLSVVRPGIPEGMVAAVERALEKVPADRYDSAVDFAEALDHGRTHATPRPVPSVRESVAQLMTTPWMVAVVALLAAGAAGYPIVRAVLGSRAPPAFEGRPETVLVLPYRTSASSDTERSLAAEIANRVTRELNSWRSTRAVTDVELNGPMSDLGLVGPALERVADGVRLARRMEAEALVTVRVVLQGDSAHAEVALYDAATGKAVGPGIRAHGLSSEPGSLVPQVVKGILGLGDLAGSPEDLRRYSANPDALLAELEGTRCLEHWRLKDAERSLRSAIALDSTFARALHHLAMAVYWQAAEGTRRSADAQTEMAQLSTAAVRHASGLPSGDSLHIRGFHAFLAGDYGDYAAARTIYRSLIEADSTDPYALLMLGAVEYADGWLEEKPGGKLAPRGNLNIAVRAFSNLVRREVGFDLGYGHLGDIYREVAGSVGGGGCIGFERPRQDLLIGWEAPTPHQMLSFCPTVLDSIVWMPREAIDPRTHAAALANVDRMTGDWTRLLRWWAGTAPQASKPRIELASVALDERSHLGVAPPETIDSLARVALRFTGEALALRSDTLPVDLIQLGALHLGAGDVDTALALTQTGLARLGTEAPPAFAANVYLAMGRPARALEIVTGRSNQRYFEDPETGALIAYGGAERVLDRIRVLGATGVTGAPLQGELRELTKIWSDPRYSDRDRRLLRENATLEMLVALSGDSTALVTWKNGLDSPGPLWLALVSSATDTALARQQMIQATSIETPGIAEADRHFVIGVVAGRLGDHRLAIEVFSRLDSLPLSVDMLDTRWGLRCLSYLLRAEQYEALGEPAHAREYYDRFLGAWRHADTLEAASVEAARQRVQKVKMDR
jgi:tetratricopeptide (TPR) repeat protein